MIKKPMNIKLYNDTYFSAKVQQAFTSNSHYRYSAFIDTIASKPHKNMPRITPAAELFQESGNPFPTIEYIETTTLKPHSSHTINFNNTLHNKLFLIKYTSEGTMKRQWYPVKIDIHSTKEINPNYIQDHKCWWILLAKHPQDSKKSNEHSRWWTNWYE